MPDDGKRTTVERVNSSGPLGFHLTEDLTRTHRASIVTETAGQSEETWTPGHRMHQRLVHPLLQPQPDLHGGRQKLQSTSPEQSSRARRGSKEAHRQDGCWIYSARDKRSLSSLKWHQRGGAFVYPYLISSELLLLRQHDGTLLTRFVEY